MSFPPLLTATSLADRLGLDKPPEPGSALGRLWATALADASAEMRRVIGQPLTAGTATIEVVLDEHGRAHLPLCPVREISEVRTSDNRVLAADTYLVRSGRFWMPAHRLYRGDYLTVTLAYGWVEIPEDIQRYTAVLAAAQIAAAARRNLGMTGGVTSISVDDGRIALVDAPIEIPDRLAEQLRAAYGGRH